MTQHSDHPTLTDYLDRSTSIKRKAEQIMNCEPPHIYGVHGDWGAGKTSYLKQLRCHLDGSESDCKGIFDPLLQKAHHKDDVITIWFDAWRYQHEAVPVIALIQEIRKQLGVWAKAGRQAKKLLDVTVTSVLNGFDDFAKFLSLEASPINLKNIQAAGESWEKDHLEQRLGIDKQHQFLEEAVDSLLSTFLPRGRKRRLVVFIDDLDRCEPTAAYRLLEGLKVYLSLKNTVFILGMNQQIIEEAVALSLPGDLGEHQNEYKYAALRMRAAAYLEKLCGNIERLAPPLSPRDVLSEWIETAALKHQVILALGKNNGDEILCLPPNPRKLKALANRINEWFSKLPNGQQLATIDYQVLIFLAYLYQFHGELFQRLHYTPAFTRQIMRWVKNDLTTDQQPNSSAPVVTKLPDYFGALDLPIASKSAASNLGMVAPTIESTFPNPYSSKMFWIAPLLIEADLQESDVTPIMRTICN